jgi:hypothetical protein
MERCSRTHRVRPRAERGRRLTNRILPSRVASALHSCDEVEPARVVAQRLITAVLASADRKEDAGNGPAKRTRLVRRFAPSR